MKHTHSHTHTQITFHLVVKTNIIMNVQENKFSWKYTIRQSNLERQNHHVLFHMLEPTSLKHLYRSRDNYGYRL